MERGRIGYAPGDGRGVFWGIVALEFIWGKGGIREIPVQGIGVGGVVVSSDLEEIGSGGQPVQVDGFCVLERLGA